MRIVVFEIGEESFALPVDAVQEVVEPRLVTGLPFVPDYVEGLVNIYGRVVLLIDLAVYLRSSHDVSREVFGEVFGEVLADGEVAEGQQNLIVADIKGQHYAFRVGAVKQLLDVADEDLNAVAPTSADDESDSVSRRGIIGAQLQWGEQTVLVLEPGGFDLGEMEAVATAHAESGQVRFGGAEIKGSDADSAAAAAADSLSCLLVRVGRERYALPLEEILEVFARGNLTPIPGAPAEFLGLTLVRGTPIPALSMPGLLGTDEAATEGGFLVSADVGGLILGLAVDDVVGIKSFTEDELREINDEQTGIQSLIVDEGGQMLGLIIPTRFIGAERMERYRQVLPQQNDESKTRRQVESRQYLNFELGRERCALPIERVRRVAEYKPFSVLPELEGGMIQGVVDLGSRVMPVVDLRRQMGFDEKTDTTTSFIVADVDGDDWALLVDRVERLIKIDVDQVEIAEGSENTFVRNIGKLNSNLYAILSLQPLSDRGAEVERATAAAAS